MKFRAHDTFFIRKGWLNKGLRHISENPEVFISREKNPADTFGIGVNMVKALRYWMQAVGLTTETTVNRRLQHFTKLGEIIFENDEYIEEFGTLFLMQYELATNEKMATSWYFFFNEFEMVEFNKENFVNSLRNYISGKNFEIPAERSLEDDFTCIINTYLPRLKFGQKISPEFNMNCPLSQIGLIAVSDENKKIYKKTPPKFSNVHPLVALSIILRNTEGKKEIPLTHLINNTCSIGKIFNLDILTLLKILEQIEKLGFIKINRTAGLDVVKIKTKLSPFECVKKYYKSINE